MVAGSVAATIVEIAAGSRQHSLLPSNRGLLAALLQNQDHLESDSHALRAMPPTQHSGSDAHNTVSYMALVAKTEGVLGKQNKKRQKYKETGFLF